MLNEQIRCKNCGRPINKDEQQNFFSFCYDCFKDYKSSRMREAESRMREATVMRIIGIVIGIGGLVTIFLLSLEIYF